MPSPRGKRVQRQPMTNGGINVEIGNPSYNMYEVEHDNHTDAGSFLKPNFTLDPQKVCVNDFFIIEHMEKMNFKINNKSWALPLRLYHIYIYIYIYIIL